MRPIYLALAVWVLASAVVMAAMPSEDVRCVQTFLADTAFDPGAADGVLGNKTVQAGNGFLKQFGLGENLPALSADTAAAWCVYVQSDAARDIVEIAAIRVYAVDLKELAAIDDGVGPVPFDFSRFKVTDRYDGLRCRYAIAMPLRSAEGEFTIAGGHLVFDKGQWFTGGLASPEVFQRFNLALTEDGEMVGKLPVFANRIDAGEVAKEPGMTIVAGKDGSLGADIPTGSINLDINNSNRGLLQVLNCVPDGQPFQGQYAFDFNKYKIDERLDGVDCSVTLNRRQGSGPSAKIESIGYAMFNLVKGHFDFTFGSWSTGSPASLDHFETANLAITKDRRVVGIWDIWPMFQDKAKWPPATVIMTGKEGKLGSPLPEGELVFQPDLGTDVVMNVQGCH